MCGRGGGVGGVFKGTGSLCSRHTFIRAGHSLENRGRWVKDL